MRLSKFKYIFLVIGVAILIIFLSSIGKQSFKESLANFTLPLLAYVLILTLLNISVKALRWQVLINIVSNKKIPFTFSFLSIIAGVAGGSIMPGRFEVIKPMLLKTRENMAFSKTAPALFMERIFDFATLGLLFLSAVIVVPSQNLLGNSITILIITLIVSGIIIKFVPTSLYENIVQYTIAKIPLKKGIKEKGKDFTERFFRTLKIIESSRSSLFLLGISFLAIFIEILRLNLILHALGIPISLPALILAFSLSVLISVLSMIPGGIGISEISLAGIISLLVPSASSGLVKSAIIANRLFAYYALIVIGTFIIFFYANSNFMKKKN